MGAYYQPSLFNSNGEFITNLNGFSLEEYVKSKDDEIYLGGFKFLEHQYHFNLITQNLYHILKEKTDFKNPNSWLIINTLCDYDPKNTFKNQVDFNENCVSTPEKYYYSLNNISQDLGLWSDLEEVVSKFTQESYLYKNYKNIHGKDEQEVLEQKYITRGYIVCPELKQYINLEIFSAPEELVISPLGLLTRGSIKYQGGGDLDFQIIKKDSFDINLVSSWKDKLLFYIEKLENLNQVEIDSFKDISNKIFLKKNDLWLCL